METLSQQLSCSLLEEDFGQNSDLLFIFENKNTSSTGISLMHNSVAGEGDMTKLT